MARSSSLTREMYDRLTPQERDEMVTPATYVAKRPMGEKKWRIFMRARDNGRIIETEVGLKGYLSEAKATAEAQKMQDKENASVEKVKAKFAFFEKLNKAADTSAYKTMKAIADEALELAEAYSGKDSERVKELSAQFQKLP